MALRAGSSAPRRERPCSSGERDEEAELGGRNLSAQTGVRVHPPKGLEGSFSPHCSVLSYSATSEASPKCLPRWSRKLCSVYLFLTLQEQ